MRVKTVDLIGMVTIENVSIFNLTPVGSITDTSETGSEDIDSQDLFDEGWRREIKANRRERSRSAVRRAKEIHGTNCQVCGFNFGGYYGEHGEGFIEAHHLSPLSPSIGSDNHRRTNPRTDMRVVCSNCHRMLHRGSRLLTIDELREKLTNAH